MAIGNPVAFDASALERLTRGFISITTWSPLDGVDGELNIRPARLHPDAANAREGGVPHALILVVREGLRRRHRDGVAGVDAHGIEVLDAADHDAVVGPVAHHLELVFLPARDRPFDQDLRDGAGRQPGRGDPGQPFVVVGDPGARPPRM